MEINLASLGEHFSTPEAAAEYLEQIRWPDGPVCPHCREHERKPYRLKVKGTKRRLWKCARCRKQFTVTVGTIFESSHIPLQKWLLAFYLLCSSKKGMSAHQLHRMLKVTYKTAWFMAHRIREAMREPAFVDLLTGTVEIDETYVGGKAKNMHAHKRPQLPGRGAENKFPVLTLVQRDGRARSFHMANVKGHALKGAVKRHVDREAKLMTDAFGSYRGLENEFAAHEVIDHIQEYARGDVHINTVESYFATLKRGVTGVYHHVSEAHLPRYLSEFDFRYNLRNTSDGTRTVVALSQAEGKRLTYRDSP